MSTSLKTNIGFGLACLLICFATVSSHFSVSQFIEDTQLTNQTLKVREHIEKLSNHYFGAQNNIRGYHMSEQNYYLDLHYQEKNEARNNLATLKELTKDNPVQIENLKVTQNLIDEKFKTWEESFQLRKTGGWEAIKSRARGEETKSLDKKIFDSFDVLRTEENRLLAERTQLHSFQSRITQITNAASGALACILIIFAVYIVYRDNRRRQQAEEFVNRFFTMSLDLLCISGMDGMFKHLSPSYSEVLGYSLQELYSRPIVDFLHPDDIDKTNREIALQMKGHKVMEFENRFRHSDGRYLTFSWKSVPVGDFMYAVARDVTNQKEFEADILQAREAAQKATIAKSSFLANMSHEIRTPLNGIVGMTEILGRTDLNSEQKKFLGAIRTSSTSLLKIVNEILDFSKIEAGQVHLDSIDFELGNLIEENISLVGVLAHKKGIELETSIDSKIPPVLKGDSAKMSQIILNFISNSIKFTERGKITIQAECIDRTETDCQLKISVTDTGIGITPEQKAAIFQPFVQADTSTARRFGGTGLGLSICKKFIEVMGGQIGVDSIPGSGSVFWFKVTLKVSRLNTLNGVVLPSPTKDTHNQGADKNQLAKRKNIRILVVEDNRMNQMIIMNMMAILGYSATLAENGREAVHVFNHSDFDLILMDQHMPVMDGIEASAQIRIQEQGSGKRVPIIAFTATLIQEEQKDKFNHLMDDFILKPVSLDLLEHTLMKWESRIPKANS